MDKELLFEFLRTKFLEAGLSVEEANLQISRLDKRYSTMTADAIAADVRARGGASHFAEAIILRRNTVLLRDPEYKRFAENTGSIIPPLHEPAEKEVYMEQTAKRNDADTEETLMQWFESDKPEAESDALPSTKAVPTKPTEQRVAHTRSTEPPTAAPQSNQNAQNALQKPTSPKTQTTSAPDLEIPTKAKQDLGSTRVVDIPDTRKPTTTPVFSAERVQDDRSGDKKNTRREKTERTPKNVLQTKPKTRAERKIKKQKTTLADITYWGEGTEEGYRRFRILFWLSLPFVIVLLAAIAVLFMSIIALLGAAIAALVVLLVGEVAIGSAVSIIGVIYGVSQLFSSIPIGLFELGIAVTVLGATMLLGIIVYNLAVRFLPFVLKQFFRFIRFFISFLQDLYYYLKGECYRR